MECRRGKGEEIKMECMGEERRMFDRGAKGIMK